MNRKAIKNIVTGLILIFFLAYNYYLSSKSNLDYFSESVLSSGNFLFDMLIDISKSIGFQLETPKPRDIVGRVVRGLNIGFNIVFAFLFTEKMSYERKILVGGMLGALGGAVLLLLLKKITGNIVFHEQAGRIVQIISAPFLFLLMFPFVKFIQKLSASEKT